MFKPERKQIYLYNEVNKNADLILFSNDYSTTLVNIYTNGSFYERIDGLKIDNLGYVAIDRVYTVNNYNPKYKRYIFNEKDRSLYGSLSDRQFSQIINAINMLFSEEIKFIPSRGFFYKDEYDAEMSKIEADRASKEKVKEETEPAEDVDEVSTTTVTTETTTTVTTTVEKKESVKRKSYYILSLTSGPEESDETKIKRYVYRTQSKSDVAVSNNVPYGFTEDEVLDIAILDIGVVAEKFNVNRAMASVMKRNAMAIINGEQEKKKSKNNTYIEFFENECTINEVVELFGEENRKSIENVYKYYKTILEANADKDNGIRVLNKYANFEKIFDSKYKMAKFFTETSYDDFCKKEHCTHAYTRMIYDNAFKELNKNPYFIAFSNPSVFDEEKFEEFRNEIESSRDSIIANRINKRILINIDMLKDSFEETYDDHPDIISGSIDIPDSVPLELKNHFKMLLKKRFFNKQYRYSKEDFFEGFENMSNEDIQILYMERYNNVKHAYKKFAKGGGSLQPSSTNTSSI